MRLARQVAQLRALVCGRLQLYVLSNRVQLSTFAVLKNLLPLKFENFKGENSLKLKSVFDFDYLHSKKILNQCKVSFSDICTLKIITFK